jgi:EAL domain-containing protein (putative c-di-GMP-specific phosphodiesterase class I)
MRRFVRGLGLLVLLAAVGPRRVGTIENAEQLGLLKTLGCELGKGYHFARRLPSNHTTGLLASGLLPPRSNDRLNQA